MEQWTINCITPDQAITLHGLMSERIKRSSTQTAYQYFDNNRQIWTTFTWQAMNTRIETCALALSRQSLNKGSRVGIMINNCPDWVVFEQAALRLGLVVVPLYPNDRPDNFAYIVNDAQIQCLLFETTSQWQIIAEALPTLDQVPQFLSIEKIAVEATSVSITQFDTWLNAHTESAPSPLPTHPTDAHALATIVYTSGTTGRPKGVMLSHYNILFDAHAGTQAITIYEQDILLSFLPLSHTLERTAGYYLSMMTGAQVAFSRSIAQLADDLVAIKPTILISVPRIFERVYTKIQTQLESKSTLARTLFNATLTVGKQRFEHRQGRAPKVWQLALWPLLNRLVAKNVANKLGGRLRFAISGGAPLQEKVANTFIHLGIPIQQGYGLTETSPVISVNTLTNNIPASIGTPLPGIEVRIDENQELQTKSPSVMLGYWNNIEATRDIMTEDGWLKTGDLAQRKGEHLYITGRLKEILVLSTGEKIPPVDMELAITLDPLFEHAMIIGESKPYLSAIVSLEQEAWNRYSQRFGINPNDTASLVNPTILRDILEKITDLLSDFPGYACVHEVALVAEPWTVENEILTPTLKVRRSKIMHQYQQQIEQLYSGH